MLCSINRISRCSPKAQKSDHNRYRVPTQLVLGLSVRWSTSKSTQASSGITLTNGESDPQTTQSPIRCVIGTSARSRT